MRSRRAVHQENEGAGQSFDVVSMASVNEAVAVIEERTVMG
jgi:hypothetical protein